MPHDTDTIAAVASPPGRSPRGIVRLSGPAAPDILHALTGQRPEPRTLTSVRLKQPHLPALAWCAPAPNTYTGQDTAELHLVGHPLLLDQVLQACLQHGARLAEPGEYTFRAYTLGRLDLTQAEGVAATISAVSDAQLAAATQLRTGKLGQTAHQLTDRLGTLLALVEAGIDFVDQEDVHPISPRDLHAGLTELISQLQHLLRRTRRWADVATPPRVVLLGPPSVGKSTLLNALLGQTRAVIDAAPGTTRDVLAEPLTLDTPAGPIEIILIDLAGLDDPADALDHRVQQGVQRTLHHADLLLLIRDTPKPPDLATPTLRVWTKADLSAAPHNSLAVSAHTGQGLTDLKLAIADALQDRVRSLTADTLALQPRHETALRDALQTLEAVPPMLNPDAPGLDDVELVAGQMRQALDTLAGLGGELTPDDIIGKVFATFCVGK